MQCFLSFERRHTNSPLLREKYADFMNEYAQLENMTRVDSLIVSATVYLPHYSVLRNHNPDKIRMVFNASAKSSSGYSLNDKLPAGPKLRITAFDRPVSVEDV